MGSDTKKVDSSILQGWPTAVPDVDHYLNLDESSGTPDTGDYISADDDYDDESSYRDSFTKLDAVNFTEEDTVTDIQVYMYAYGYGDSSKLIEVHVTNSDGTVADEVAVPGKAPALVSVTFTEDSALEAWKLSTINDITAIEIRPLVDGKDNDNDVWTVYAIYFRANFIDPPSGGPRGPLVLPLNGPFRGPI